MTEQKTTTAVSANSLSSIQVMILVAISGFLLLNTESGQNLKERVFNSSVVTASTKLEIKEPSPLYLNFVTPVVEVLEPVDVKPNGVLRKRLLELRDFYYLFSSSVERNAEYFNNSSDFRKYNIITLNLAYRDLAENDEIVDPPPIEEAIESSLQNVISLEPNAELDAKEVSEVLLAISWAFDQKLKK